MEPTPCTHSTGRRQLTPAGVAILIVECPHRRLLGQLLKGLPGAGGLQ
jgi:hypothetical protein